MVYRITTGIGAILTLAAALAQAQTFIVVHHHLHGSSIGALKVTDAGIQFTETGKHQEHSRNWKYEQIQQLELTRHTLSVLTYEDQKWQPGVDRNYRFDVPKGFAASVYPMWRDKLDQRFVAAVAEQQPTALAEFPAKLTGFLSGVQGTLFFTEDEIVFRARRSGQSRTWRFSDIDNIASVGPFDLSIVTFENHSREFRFQLQRPMEEARFNELWRLVNRSSLAVHVVH